MGVESRELIMLSGFFRSKHSVIIAKHKKLKLDGDLQGISSKKIRSDRNDMVTRDARVRGFLTIFFFSKNLKEKKI